VTGTSSLSCKHKKKPGGSKPGERRGGRQRGTPNKTTALVASAMNAAAADPAITPLDFMLGLMADPNVDPSLRFKAAQASAMYVHPKPLGTPADPAESAKPIIDMTADDLDHPLMVRRVMRTRN
jgi:hypothetical protein